MLTNADNILCSGSLMKSVFLALILFAQSCTSAPCSCSPIIYKWKLNLNSTCPISSVIPANDGVGCSPNYKWKLNLNSTCPISSAIPTNDGVGYGHCYITPSQLPIVKVILLGFKEFDEDPDNHINFKQVSGEWFDGDDMEIESITKTDTGLYTAASSFHLHGETAGGLAVTMKWFVEYTNACDVNPYANIANIAWMEFVSFYNVECLQTCVPYCLK